MGAWWWLKEPLLVRTTANGAGIAPPLSAATELPLVLLLGFLRGLRGQLHTMDAHGSPQAVTKARHTARTGPSTTVLATLPALARPLASGTRPSLRML